ncbi:MAG: HAD family hydrolase [Candidatus Limnocylindria bacterium]
MPYRLVCLDAGFTLLAPRRTLAESLAGVLAENGHAVGQEDLRRAWEVADRWFWDEYHRPDNRTWGDDAAIERTWRAYHATMLAELGVTDRAHDLIDAILGSQFAADAWELYPDVVPALVALRAQPDLAIAVISDWGSNLGAILSGLGLDPFLDFVLASGAVGLAKPDPALFGAALERAGAAPTEALMVGDSLRADHDGARAAGLDAVLLVRPEGSVERRQVPAGTRTIASLAELPPIVTGAARAR